jgi:hypothetical protein
VSNGELIAAALYLGFAVTFNTTCVNALVGVNKLQVRKLTHTARPEASMPAMTAMKIP